MCTRPGFGLLIAYTNILLYSICAIIFICLLANKNVVDELVREEIAKHPQLDANSRK